ncbi:MAG: hypothetical protein A2Y00_03835 [Omnitrophica WOR_2 bacterium GWF2_43_52]|nr:MAG: hypothetical protein A2Y01_03370 [Omnitrophica WOR_2 bacterium GWC2_44_8]OGX22564.1 MAG: hypothetical protein A2Y00_03835 [Omnitrophica WOR_2 bacterium GWF2_43_52]OGX52942.1 MAG: hypothetical protein A2460_07945 [Omnitrophica WOR_2 bacterium RIFOXYC2_FULL_43_9]HAH21431.1 hypothetical protein [Candidatus Omnitrophota bacterium]HBG64653.1 hypothetical protein [Candidatus Omnitrophota bacterium]
MKNAEAKRAGYDQKMQKMLAILKFTKTNLTIYPIRRQVYFYIPYIVKQEVTTDISGHKIINLGAKLV